MKMESLQNNLASYIAENSRLFNKHAERIVYALFGSSWAAMFTTETNLEKKQFYIVIFLCILYLSIEMVYRIYNATHRTSFTQVCSIWEIRT